MPPAVSVMRTQFARDYAPTVGDIDSQTHLRVKPMAGEEVGGSTLKRRAYYRREDKWDPALEVQKSPRTLLPHSIIMGGNI